MPGAWVPSPPKCRDAVHDPDDPGIFRFVCMWVSMCTSEEDVPTFCLLVYVQIDNKVVTWQSAQSEFGKHLSFP